MTPSFMRSGPVLESDLVARRAFLLISLAWDATECCDMSLSILG